MRGIARRLSRPATRRCRAHIARRRQRCGLQSRPSRRTEPVMPIAAADKWEQIALLADGNLAEVPYATLLLAFSRVGRTGVLELRRKPVEKRRRLASRGRGERP